MALINLRLDSDSNIRGAIVFYVEMGNYNFAGKNIRNQSAVYTVAQSAAVVARAVAVFLSEGPYAWLSLIIGLTMSFFVLGYSGSATKTFWETVVFGPVFAFAVLPAFGFAVEGFETLAILPMTDRELSQFTSQVAGYVVFLMWFVTTLIVIRVDRYY